VSLLSGQWGSLYYNIEIHTPYRGRFKIELDAHLIVDSAGKVVDIITK
jgi:hypothetical protein